MTASAGGGSAGGSGGRGLWMWAVAVVVIGLLLFFIGRRGSDGPPYDPRSTSEDGTRAVVRLIEDLGGSVEIIQGAPASADAGDVALILVDRYRSNDPDLDPDLADSLAAEVLTIRRWVEQGGTLIVADPESQFNPSEARELHSGGTTCDIDALAGLTIDTDADDGSIFAVDYSSTGDRQACFGSTGQAAVVVAQRGEGTSVAFGLRDLVTNQHLGTADHAQLAVALLVPSPGTRVVILDGPTFSTGTETLGDLVPSGVKWGLGLAAVAFGFFALGRAFRHGRPVREPQLVEIAGSELVVAVGTMYERSRQVDSAAATLRQLAQDDLAHDLGLPKNSSVDAIADGLSRLSTGADGLQPEAIGQTLAHRQVQTEDELVQLANEIDALRHVVGRRHPDQQKPPESTDLMRTRL